MGSKFDLPKANLNFLSPNFSTTILTSLQKFKISICEFNLQRSNLKLKFASTLKLKHQLTLVFREKLQIWFWLFFHLRHRLLLRLNLEHKGYKSDPQKSKFKIFNAKFYPYDPHTKALSLQNLKFTSVNLFVFSLLQLFFGLKFSYKFDMKSKI